MDPAEKLERTQWDFFWVSPGARVVSRPELAYVACDRDVGYLNTVTRTRATRRRLPALIEEVDTAHAGVLSRWLVPSTFDTAALVEALSRSGRRPAHTHEAAALDVREFTPRDTEGVVVREVRTRADLRACTDVAAAAFGAASTPRGEEQILDELRLCTQPDRRVMRFVVYDEFTGEPLSSGGMNLYPDLAFGFLWAGGTVPHGRKRGAYSALLAARVRRADELGFEHVGLYARLGSSAPIVLRQGFKTYGQMTYWERKARTQDLR